MHPVPSEPRHGRVCIVMLMVTVALLTAVLIHLQTGLSTGTGYAVFKHQSARPFKAQIFTTRRLDTRAVNDGEHRALYDEYKAKGAQFVEYLDIEDDSLLIATLRRDGKLRLAQPLQSIYTKTSDLHSNGWSIQPLDSSAWRDRLPILHALQDLGYSTTPQPQGKNSLVDCRHTEISFVNGKRYWPTGGEYIGVYNPSQGLIMTTYALSPASAIAEDDSDLEDEEDHPYIDPSPLSRWSDVTFLAYQDECQKQGKSVKDLNGFFGVLIDGEDAAKVISQVLYLSGAKPNAQGAIEAPKWEDRKKFSMDSDEGKALLASCLNGGLSWLLLQHREQLGIKKVVSVDVFQSERESDNGSCLWFKIEDGQRSDACEAGHARRGASGAGKCSSRLTAASQVLSTLSAHAAATRITHAHSRLATVETSRI